MTRRLSSTPTRADRILLSRASLISIVKNAAVLHSDAADAALLYAGSDLDAVAQRLAVMDHTVDRLAKLIERTRIAVGAEYERTQPTQAEAVAS